MIDGLEIEVKNWNNAYSFSSEENGKKRIYTIYSPELKQKLREIIFPCEVPSEVRAQYKGKNSHGDCILYQPGKGDLPDQLTLINKEVALDQQELEEERKEREEKKEWEQRKVEWKKREVELGIPSSSGAKRSYWCFKDSEGNVSEEGMYLKSETQSYLISLVGKTNNSPQIQAIADKETEKIKNENSLSQGEKQDFTLHHQVLPKK